MMIRVTDKELLEKTGGIVQGMSGSPILQNGKLVGAVTHVLINDPSAGLRHWDRANARNGAKPVTICFPLCIFCGDFVKIHDKYLKNTA